MEVAGSRNLCNLTVFDQGDSLNDKYLIFIYELDDRQLEMCRMFSSLLHYLTFFTGGLFSSYFYNGSPTTQKGD